MKNLAIIGNHGSGQTELATRFCARVPDYTYIGFAKEPLQPEGGRSDPWKADQPLHFSLPSPVAPADYYEAIAAIRSSQELGNRFVVDGFPRSLENWILLEMIRDEPITYVYLEAPVDVCVARLVLRPDYVTSIETRVQRIAKRLQAFEDETLPTLAAIQHQVIHNRGDGEHLLSVCVDRLKLLAGIRPDDVAAPAYKLEGIFS